MLSLKSAIIEMKDVFCGLVSRTDTAVNDSKLGDMAMETSKTARDWKQSDYPRTVAKG